LGSYKASARLSDRLEDAGFADAMRADLAAECGRDPVAVLTPMLTRTPGEPEAGSPHMPVICSTGGRLALVWALRSGPAHAITAAILGFFSVFLITDG
jgi:hypothetical protein